MLEPRPVVVRSLVRVLVFCATLLSVIFTPGAIIYDNTSEFLDRVFNERREYGDQVDLEGDARQLTQILFEYFGEFEPDGDEQVKVRVYTNDQQYDRYRKRPTTLLFESEWIPITPGFGTRAVTGLDLPLPYKTITVTFKFDGVRTNETAGLLFYGPPDVGYSFNEIWLLGNSGNWVPVLYSTDDPTHRASAGMRLMAEALVLRDQAQTNSTGSVALREGPKQTRIAQTFTPSVNGRLNHVVVKAQFTNSAFIRVRILDAAGQGPGPTVLGTRFMVQGTGGPHTLNFIDETIYLKAGKRYAIEMSTTAPPNDGRDYLVPVARDAYAGGELWQKDETNEDGGGRWAPAAGGDGAGLDMVFEAHLIPSDPPVELSGVRRRQIFDLGETVFLHAEVQLPDIGALTRVQFMAGDEEIGVLTNAPFSFAWTNPPTGEHALRAIAVDEFRRPFRSGPISIEVRPPGGPGNDLFANRAVVNGFSARVVKPAALATLEPGEPRPVPGYSGQTLWWSWTAPDAAPVTISAQNSSAPGTSVAVFLGDSLENLTLVTNGVPQVRFVPEPGRTYAIAVEPRVATSHVAMELAPALHLELTANVVRATNPILLSLTGSDTRNITNVQVMIGSTVIWRTNKAPASVFHRFTTSGTFNLVTVATDNRGLRTFSTQPLIVRPANDLLHNATMLNGFAAQAEILSLAATPERLDPFTFGTNTHSLWYRWTAPADGMGVIETTARPAGSVMAVFREVDEGPGFEALPLARTETTRVEFFAKGGESYFIFLAAGQPEEGTLDFRFEPANDAFARRGLLKGDQDERLFRLIGGSLEANEPPVPGIAASRSSSWWSWTAPASAQVRMASSIDGRIEIFTGSSLEGLALVASGPFHVTFEAVEGTVYHVRVWGRNDDGAEGTISLEMRGLRITRPVSQQVFARAAIIPLQAVSLGGASAQNIEFLANGVVLTNTVPSGTGRAWTNARAGSYELRARSRLDPSVRSAPVFIQVDTNLAAFESRIFAGAFSRASMVSDVSGRLRAFGARAHAGGRAEHKDAFHPAFIFRPASAAVWEQISSGQSMQLFLSNDGILYSNAVLIPFPVETGPWSKVSAGSNSFVAVTAGGELYINGMRVMDGPPAGERWLDAKFSAHGILALSDTGDLHLLGPQTGSLSRTLSRPANVERWVQIDSGMSIALALGGNGGIYRFNLAAESGRAAEPVRIDPPAAVPPWSGFAAGGEHQLFLAANGQLYAMGQNTEGQLGLGRFSEAEFLQPVPFPAGVSRWTQIAAGEHHSLALGDDCRLYVWGSNAEGQLGLGRHFANAPRPLALDGVGPFCPPGPPEIKTLELAPDGSITLSFETILNRWSYIEHSEDLRTWRRLPGSIGGDGFDARWSDSGPPGTVRPPREDRQRFYRIARE